MIMDSKELYDRMKKIQEPRGHFFNADRLRTDELLNALYMCLREDLPKNLFKTNPGRHFSLQLPLSPQLQA